MGDKKISKRNPKELYNYYQFANKENKRKIKLLLIATVGVIGIVIFLALYSLVTNLIRTFQTDYNNGNTVNIEQQAQLAIEEEKKRQEEDNQKAIDLTEEFNSYGIPHIDPSGNFMITFATPYTSRNLIVIVYNKETPEKYQQEADAIITQAKKTIDIDTVSYQFP